MKTPILITFKRSQNIGCGIHHPFFLKVTEVFLGPFQTSMMKIFIENN